MSAAKCCWVLLLLLLTATPATCWQQLVTATIFIDQTLLTFFALSSVSKSFAKSCKTQVQ
jgi:hypothetical protein